MGQLSIPFTVLELSASNEPALFGRAREPRSPSRAVLPPAEAEALLHRALAYAALAEQRLAQQAARIAELENLSITDPLTGLLNRRGFEQALARCLANAARHGEQGLVAYLDLDGFKAINDRFGHAAGDAVLKSFAKFLRRGVRATDYVARLGGDEFAVLFTRAQPTAAQAIVLKLKDRLRRSTVDVAGATLPLRASVGAARYDRDTSAEDLMSEADQAMYREKKRIAPAA